VGSHEVRFPVEISYGSRGGPGFSTSVVELDAGTEERISRWNGARRRYNARFGIREPAAIADVLEFYIAREGAAHGFRWKDWTDYSTAEDHRDDPTHLDVQIGTGDGSTTQFQLVKRYASGGVTRTRNLTKPVAGTVRVALDGLEQTTGWSVDTTTGIVTFDTAPAEDVVISAGCEFDVPVRFGEEVDESALQIQHDFFEAETLADVPVVEIVSEETTQDEFFFGGGTTLSLTADTSISLLTARAWSVTPDAAGRKLMLPDESSTPQGGPIFFLENASGTHSFLLTDDEGTTVATIAASTSCVLYLVGTSWKVLG
jgi:uncharacterized protein (TIGR02217 family)